MAMSSRASSSPSAMHSEQARAMAGAGRASFVCLRSLAGCDNSSLNEDETTFHVRSLNLVEDSPTLEIDLDDTTMSHGRLRQAPPASPPGHPGQHTLSFSAILPADLDDDDDDETSTPVSGASAYTFRRHRIYGGGLRRDGRHPHAS